MKQTSHRRPSTIPYRTLGRTGERVSAIGLGGWHLGLGHVDEQLSFRIDPRRRAQREASAVPRRMIRGALLADIVPTFDMINMIGGECDR